MTSLLLPRRIDASRPALVRVAPDAVPAGFPSPAQDYYEGPLDFNTHLMDDPDGTFVARVAVSSMTGDGIFDGDEVIVSRARRPVDGNIVVAVLNGELTLKHLGVTRRGVYLLSSNPEFPAIAVPELADFTIWGTATFGIRHLT
ncbi:MAG: peptidase S24 [Microbacterium sp. 14-71-5]|nr:MAG: peptidase S24 [Microbacterium sp. 14-71-5]